MNQHRENQNVPPIFQMPSGRRGNPMNRPELNQKPDRQLKSNNKKSKTPGISIPLLSQFKDESGSYDLDKIMTTTRQVNEIYTKVSPIISSFRKK